MTIIDSIEAQIGAEALDRLRFEEDRAPGEEYGRVHIRCRCGQALMQTPFSSATIPPGSARRVLTDLTEEREPRIGRIASAVVSAGDGPCPCHPNGADAR